MSSLLLFNTYLLWKYNCEPLWWRAQRGHIQYEHDLCIIQGLIQDFKLGGAHLKKIAPTRGRRENFWGISYEKSRFYAKKSYFSNFRGGERNFWGISCEKSRFYAKKNHIFTNFRGGARRVRPPPESAPVIHLPLLSVYGVQSLTYRLSFYLLLISHPIWTIVTTRPFENGRVVTIADLKWRCRTTGAWGMDFVSSSPLFSTTPPFFKMFI